MSDQINKYSIDYSGEIDAIVAEILEDYGKGREIDRMMNKAIPDQDVVNDIIRRMLVILFPGYYRDNMFRTGNTFSKVSVQIEETMFLLSKQIQYALQYGPGFEEADKMVRQAEAKRICIEFIKKIPKIREYLNTDLEATFDGDPAANSKEEIVLSYPGLFAIAVYRIAHELVLLNVPLIPRMMSEYAHRRTGVDIHPAATIGKYFFIDHATGIVVGSTSDIGEHVKVYQGVTIGALSTKEGRKLHGSKRHPTIEDNVTLYSGATILGGNTVIGEGSVIGGNCFVTKSVAPYSRVNIQTRETKVDEGRE